jgi:hypothetical protein
MNIAVTEYGIYRQVQQAARQKDVDDADGEAGLVKGHGLQKEGAAGGAAGVRKGGLEQRPAPAIK